MRSPLPRLLLGSLACLAALLGLTASSSAADQGVIAFQGFRSGSPPGIFTIAPSGGGEERVGAGLQPSLSRDGKKIVYVQTKTGDLFTMNADGSDPTQITDDPGTDTEPAFSPDGKQIVFVGARPDEPRHVVVVDADGGNEKQLTHGKGVEYEPAYSPDGKQIVFVRGPGEVQLVTMTADGNDPTQLTARGSDLSGYSSPSYSPNGKSILFQAFDRVLRIFSFDAADGKNLNDIAQGVEPAYSPDGASIVFRRSHSLLTMDADGSAIKQLTDQDKGGGSDSRPSWAR